MPRRKPAYSRTDVRTAWKLMEDMGLEPVAVKFHPDGTFRIMTKKHALMTSKAQIDNNMNDNNLNEWDEVLK